MSENSSVSARESVACINIIYNRLLDILANDPDGRTGHADDILLEAAAKYLDAAEYPEIYAAMIEIVTRQCRKTALHKMRRMYVEPQDMEDYLSELKVIVAVHMKEYDASKGKPATFLTPYINGDFFRERNRGTTKYNAWKRRLVRLAQNQLIAEGIPNPDVKEIADRINSLFRQSIDFTPGMVRNTFLDMKCCITLNEAWKEADGSCNPEELYLENEKAEQMEKAVAGMNDEEKTLYGIYYDYYCSDKPGNNSLRKKPPLTYLAKAMKEKTGNRYSAEKIKKLQYSMKDCLISVIYE